MTESEEDQLIQGMATEFQNGVPNSIADQNSTRVTQLLYALKQFFVSYAQSVGLIKVTSLSTITELQSFSRGNISSILVSDPVRGGLFYYFSTGYTADGGIIIPASGGGYWVRQYANTIQASWYALNGDGITADNINIQKAIDAQQTKGGVVELPVGTFLLNSAIVGRSKVELRGQGDNTILLLNSNSGAINTQGSVDTTAYSFVSQPLRSTFTFQTTTTPTYVAGDWIRLRSDDIWLSNSDGNKEGWITRVKSIAGDVTTMMNPLPMNLTLSSARVEKINPVANFSLTNLRLKNIPNTRLVSLSTFKFCVSLKIENVSAEGSDEAGFDIQNTWESTINRVRCEDFIDDPANGRYGYGVAFSGACYNIVVSNSTFRNTRHAVTTLGDPTAYGVPRNITFSSCHSSEASLTHFDNHQLGEELTYIGCTATGGKSQVSFGFQARARSCTYIACVAYNCTGAGFYIINGSINKFTNLYGCIASQTRYGSGLIMTSGVNVTVIGGRFTESDYYGIQISGINAPNSFLINGATISDNNRLAGSIDGISIDSSNGGIITNCEIGRVISFTTWNQRYGIITTNSTNVSVVNNHFKVNGTGSYNLVGAGHIASGNRFDTGSDVNIIKETAIVPGTLAPTTTPSFIGQRFIDTVAKKEYTATGVSSSADWTILN